MEDKKYGVIHEIGDYSGVRELSEEDNKKVNQQILNEQKERESKDK